LFLPTSYPPSLPQSLPPSLILSVNHSLIHKNSYMSVKKFEKRLISTVMFIKYHKALILNNPRYMWTKSTASNDNDA
jgi:hypothetical protein